MTTRAPRRAHEELRELVVAAGMAILAEEGLRTGADLTFKRVFARLEADTGIRLTNASVIRRVGSTRRSSSPRSWRGWWPAPTRSDSSVPRSTSWRPCSSRSTCRHPRPAGRHSSRSPGWRARSPSRPGWAPANWELWVGVWVVTVTNPGNKSDPKLRQALAEGLEETGEAWDQLFGTIMSRLGLRLRPGLTLRQLTESTGAMAAGYALRQASRDEDQVFERPTGAGGELQEWTLLGIGLEALGIQFLEIDPGWVPAA